MAPKIWDVIQKSNNVLLHFHPSPDPDTVGCSLTMLEALEGLGKKVTLIKGDSELPVWVTKLPGAEKIVQKNYFEIDPKEYDLFLIMDTASPNQVSKVDEVTFPDSMTTVVIDHHISNTGFGKIVLIDTNYIANSQIIYDLLKEWGVEITKNMAELLYLGMYVDSGGFKYSLTTPDTLMAAADLAKINPEFSKLIFEYENNSDPKRIIFEGMALSSIESYFSGRVAISTVNLEQMKEKGIEQKHTQGVDIANILKSVVGWDIGISFFEKDPGEVSCSFRTRDLQKYDLSKIATLLGGGGHRGAAGSPIKKPFDEAKKYLLEKLAETYPDLGTP